MRLRIYLCILGHTVLEKDWDGPVDICIIIRELLAVRANQNLTSIDLKF